MRKSQKFTPQNKTCCRTFVFRRIEIETSRIQISVPFVSFHRFNIIPAIQILMRVYTVSFDSIHDQVLSKFHENKNEDPFLLKECTTVVQ